jgi:hypothetical protein
MLKAGAARQTLPSSGAKLWCVSHIRLSSFW